MAIDEPPLMRLTFIRAPDGLNLFVWTHHHLILDGRAVSLALKELDEIYVCRRSGRDLQLPPPPSYMRYRQWAADSMPTGAREYWQTLLGAPMPARGIPTRAGPAAGTSAAVSAVDVEGQRERR